jgi:uncharacterized protein
MAWKLLELLLPRMCVESLAKIDLDMLVGRGIDSVILDLDNTILPWRDYSIPSESREWICLAREKGMKLCIASNTRNPKRLRVVAGELGVPFLDKIVKPRRKGLREAMALMGATIERTVIIGDQIFTDILGGNRLGILTILVQPMHPREFVGTKVSRMLERPVMAWIARRGLSGTKDLKQASK